MTKDNFSIANKCENLIIVRKRELTSPFTSLSSSLEFVDETPPVSSSALPPSSLEVKPFLLEEASSLGCSELEPAANVKPELELDAPAPNREIQAISTTGKQQTAQSHHAVV